MISCYFVADTATLLSLSDYVKRYPFTQTVGSMTTLDFDGESLMLSKPQLVFVPITLREKLSAKLTEVMRFASVVYISDTHELAYEAFEDGAFDYLVTPLSYQRFERCVDKYVSFYLQKPKPSSLPIAERLGVMERFFVKIDGKDALEILIDVKQLVWVQAFENSVLLMLNDGVQYKCFCTMRELEDALPGHFLRIHKSYIINCHHVAKVQGFKITFSGSQQRELIVGVTYRKAFLERKNEMAIRKVKPILLEKIYYHVTVGCLVFTGLMLDLNCSLIEI